MIGYLFQSVGGREGDEMGVHRFIFEADGGLETAQRVSPPVVGRYYSHQSTHIDRRNEPAREVNDN